MKCKIRAGGPRLIWNTIPFHVRRTEIPCKDYCALDFWSCFPSFAEIQKYWKTEIPKNWNTPDAMIIVSLVFRGVLLPSPISPFPLSSSIKLDKLIARLKTMMMIWQCWTNPRKIGPKISQNESDTPFLPFHALAKIDRMPASGPNFDANFALAPNFNPTLWVHPLERNFPPPDLPTIPRKC